MFSDKDLDQIHQRGSSIDNVQYQIKQFQNGFPPLTLVGTPSVGNGISALTDAERKSLIELFDAQSKDLDILKFVPASGAATRMFKDLFGFVASYDGSDDSYKKFSDEGEKNPAFKFLKNLENFPFYEELKTIYKSKFNQSLEEGHLKRDYKNIIDCLLQDDGLSYGSLPKALLKFHQYEDKPRTSLEEHFVEGAHYAKGKGDVVNLHFTVSPHHKEKFEEKVASIKGAFEKKYQVVYQVTYSIQKPATDTIAVDLENQPFRNEDGSILFRPAGHGALIENLNELNADVIFVKNIDNVVPEKIQATTYENKKLIAGILLNYTGKIAEFLTQLASADESTDLSAYENFLFSELLISAEDYQQMEATDKIDFLKKKLNRPVRVCGVVKNDGDPGGGPFFAKNPDGSSSLQIVETAQVDKDASDQKAIFDKATHFNPVDLVCSIKNYLGKSFDLLNYRDAATGFITQKSKDGKDLKAQELPGLWNGAMSDWITLFVEVPVITFNPVKSINDLLKKEHQ